MHSSAQHQQKCNYNATMEEVMKLGVSFCLAL